jgi:hypothetical protein
MGINAGADVVEDGLVFCVDAASKRSYPGTGTVWTDLAGENNGTLNNGPTFSSANGGIIDFDGSDDQVLINASSGINFSTILSAFIWVKFDTIGSDILMGHISYFTGGYFFWVSSASEIYTSVASTYDSTAVSLNTSDWFLLTVVRNVTAVSWYVNGTPVGTGTIGSGDHILSSIGSYYGGSHPLNGKIASVQIYNRTLTADEVRQNYNATRGRFA